MTIFDRFTVVAVPFPYAEREARKRRPAVIVSGPDLSRHGLAWVVMITSADNPPWPEDIPLIDPAEAGLARPSVIRPVKIATVEAARCTALGRLTVPTAGAVEAALARIHRG
jgi:mRNA interferase MazF